jgi:bifunctional non-homologous end joining protein LigD
MNGFESVAKLAMNSKTAGSVKEAVGTRDAILEPKYDGIRLLVNVNADGQVRLYARSGNSKTGKLPAIEAEVAANFPPNTWIDGEAVAFNADGTQDWGGAQSVLGSGEAKAAQRSGGMRLVVFDILAHGGIDARALSFRLRRQLLNEIWEGGNFTLCQLSVQLDATDENHEANLEAGFEGSMVKHLDSSYQSGKRAACSLKLKSVDTVDAVITGFKPGRPDSWIARAGMVGAITFEHYTSDGTAVQGACSGMTVPLRREITDAGDALIGQVMEVSYMTRMPGGSLRHPQFKRIRTDKTAAECRA